MSQDWEGRASIGNSEATDSSRGKVDEFYMADTALNQKEVTRLMDQCIFEKGVFCVYDSSRKIINKTQKDISPQIYQ